MTHISQRGETEFVPLVSSGARSSQPALRRLFTVGESLQATGTLPRCLGDNGHGSAWGKSAASTHAICCLSALTHPFSQRLSLPPTRSLSFRSGGRAVGWTSTIRCGRLACAASSPPSTSQSRNLSPLLHNAEPSFQAPGLQSSRTIRMRPVPKQRSCVLEGAIAQWQAVNTAVFWHVLASVDLQRLHTRTIAA